MLWTPWMRASITLHEKDHSVSFDNGDPHGSWKMVEGNADNAMIINFKCNEETTREHLFKRIPLTSCWELESRDGGHASSAE